MSDHPSQPSRRDVLRGVLATGASLTLAGSLSSCGSRDDVARVAGGDQWRQFKGATLNFISENTAPTAAIAANLRPFTDLTGINVNIVTLELTWRGTQSGPLQTATANIPATGRTITVRAVQVVELTPEGKTKRVRHYFDMATLLAQLGVSAVGA